MFGETLDAMCAVCLPLYRKGILHGPYDPVIKAHKSLEVYEQSRHEAHTYRPLAIISSCLAIDGPAYYVTKFGPVMFKGLILFHVPLLCLIATAIHSLRGSVCHSLHLRTHSTLQGRF